jgi:AcrR family transcriptional regulator
MSPTRRDLVRETRTRIVDAASRLAHERGPDGFSMDTLAHEAGVARATVYEHFGSKRALLNELASTSASHLSMPDTSGGYSDPLVALRSRLHDTCRHWTENEALMGDLMRLQAATGRTAPYNGHDDSSLRRLVEQLSAADRLRAHWPVDDAVDALAVITSYETFARLRGGGRSPDQVENVLAKLVVSIVQAGPG